MGACVGQGGVSVVRHSNGLLWQGPNCEGGQASVWQIGKLTRGQPGVWHGAQCDGAIASDGQIGRLTQGAKCVGHPTQTEGNVGGVS